MVSSALHGFIVPEFLVSSGANLERVVELVGHSYVQLFLA